MRKRRTAVLLAALGSVAAVATVAIAKPGGGPSEPGFKTAKQAYVIPAAPGVKVDPILSAGDVIGDYQMSGIPDGLGAYAQDDDKRRGRSNRRQHGGHGEDRAVVVMNHELGQSFPGKPPGVDSRISRLEIDPKTHEVHAAEYLFTGDEGYERFCSATLFEHDGRPVYFTGEETAGSGMDGSSIAMDPETGMWVDTEHFGHLQHENVVPVKLRKWVFLTTDDDFRAGQPAYLYAWIGDDFEDSIRGRGGDLYVWKADDPAEMGNPDVAKGESVPGHFVPIPQSENTSSDSLKAAATERGAFKFDRLEDATTRPGKRGRMYFADTGKLPATERGRIYQFDIDPRDPARATLKLVLDGDAGDDVVNPDNMAASRKVLVWQEDRESAFRAQGPNRIMVWDYKSAPRSVAYVQVPGTTDNNAESSGVIDASDLLGRNWWLVDVQAHNAVAPQPGPSLEPDTSEGEDGQLLAIYIPRSTGGGR